MNEATKNELNKYEKNVAARDLEDEHWCAEVRGTSSEWGGVGSTHMIHKNCNSDWPTYYGQEDIRYHGKTASPEDSISQQEGWTNIRSRYMCRRLKQLT
jgi:hypothetical protein